MDTLTKRMNLLLSEIEAQSVISFTKDDTPEIFQARNKLQAYGLIEKTSQNSWRLTKGGYETLEAGGFEQWLSGRNATKSNPIVIDNLHLGDNFGSYNQSSSLVSSIKQIQNKRPSNNSATFWKWTFGIIGLIASIATIYQVFFA